MPLFHSVLCDTLMALRCPPVNRAGNWLLCECHCSSSSLRPLESHASLSCMDYLVGLRRRSVKNGCRWVTAVRLSVSAQTDPPPRSQANGDRKCPSTSARPSLLGFSQQPQTVGYVPLSGRLDWHLAMWQSLSRKERKKKMDCRKPFKSHMKMSHLGLILPLKQEWYHCWRRIYLEISMWDFFLLNI